MTPPTHLIEYVVIACYLIFLVIIGAAFHRFNKNVSDFFRSGCRGTWWLVGASVFMGGVTANSFTSSAGVAFQAGWSVAIIYILRRQSPSAIWSISFMAAWFRCLALHHRPASHSHALRPHHPAGLRHSWNLYRNSRRRRDPLGRRRGHYASTAFGFSLTAIITILGCVGILYSIMGGLWGVMATDFVQGMILLPMTILITILCLNRVGGIGGFFHQVAAHGLTHTFSIVHAPGEYPARSFTLAWAVAMIIKQTWDQNALSVASRYFAVKDGRAARNAAMVAVIMMLAGAIFWFIPPMTAAHLSMKSRRSPRRCITPPKHLLPLQRSTSCPTA